MGEFADDAIDAGMAEWEDDGFACFPRRRTPRTEYDTFEYDHIVTETNKAWLLAASAKAQTWWPKSQCTIDEEFKFIVAPRWLVNEKIRQAVEESPHEHTDEKFHEECLRCRSEQKYNGLELSCCTLNIGDSNERK